MVCMHESDLLCETDRYDSNGSCSKLRLTPLRPCEGVNCRLVLGAELDKAGKICRRRRISSSLTKRARRRERTCNRRVPASKHSQRGAPPVESFGVLCFVLESVRTIRDGFGVSRKARGSARRS